MAVAFVQEFAIVDGDTSTTNYDKVVEELDLGGSGVEGLIVHTAGFDHDRGVFRIVDVWESREAGQRFMDERLMPIIERHGGRCGRGRVQTARQRVVVRAARRRDLVAFRSTASRSVSDRSTFFYILRDVDLLTNVDLG